MSTVSMCLTDYADIYRDNVDFKVQIVIQKILQELMSTSQHKVAVQLNKCTYNSSRKTEKRLFKTW